jgi:hypothetical protein
MLIFIVGILSFLITLLAHLVIWRLAQLKRQSHVLYVLTAIVSLGLLILFRTAAIPDFSDLGLFYSFLVFGSLTGTYLLSLPGLELESPSGLIVMAIERAGSRGANKTELYQLLSDEDCILNRMEGLEHSKFIDNREDRLFITPAGSRFFSIFFTYHQLVRRKTHGG